MIVKSFVLKRQSLDSIAAQINADTIAVVRPQRKIEALFREAIRLTLVQKKRSDAELSQIEAYFLGMSPDAAYQADVKATVEGIAAYLSE